MRILLLMTVALLLAIPAGAHVRLADDERAENEKIEKAQSKRADHESRRHEDREGKKDKGRKDKDKKDKEKKDKHKKDKEKKDKHKKDKRGKDERRHDDERDHDDERAHNDDHDDKRKHEDEDDHDGERKHDRDDDYSERVEHLLKTGLNAGVCDSLADATPGLRFMCMAFCELQTCTPDFTAQDPFQNCSTSSRWIYDRYQARRGPGDPDMPCVKQPEAVAACACWTPNELANLRAPTGAERVAFCGLNLTDANSGNSNWDIWQLVDNPADPNGRTTSVASIGAQGANGSPACSLVDTCDPATETCLNESRFMTVTPAQFAACEADVALSAANRGLNCVDFAPTP